MSREQERWARVLREFVEGLAELDLLWLQTHPDTPRLYDSGVQYQRSVISEAFSLVPGVLTRGWGTNADLVAWRVAELMLEERQGRIKTELGQKAATVRVEWRFIDRCWQYTFQVRHADGHLEDVVAEIERLQRDPGWMNRASLQELERMGFVRQATEEEIQAQRASWAHGEALMGSDADEARERQALREKTGARS